MANFLFLTVPLETLSKSGPTILLAAFAVRKLCSPLFAEVYGTAFFCFFLKSRSSEIHI